jgi:hypothetical protein
VGSAAPQGTCLVCGIKKALPGRTVCRECLEDIADAYEEHFYARDDD